MGLNFRSSLKMMGQKQAIVGDGSNSMLIIATMRVRAAADGLQNAMLQGIQSQGSMQLHNNSLGGPGTAQAGASAGLNASGTTALDP